MQFFFSSLLYIYIYYGPSPIEITPSDSNVGVSINGAQLFEGTICSVTGKNTIHIS